MNWYIFISAVLITLFIFLKIRKSAGLPLLTFRISTNNGIDYEIKCQNINEDAKPIEYVRLILCFITKMYFISRSKNEDNRTEIRYFLKSIADSEDLISGLEKFKNQINLVDEISNSKEKKQITGTLFYKNIHSRQISTIIPSRWHENQFYLSIIALVLEIIKNTDEFQNKLLHKSLKNLARYYYSDLNSTSFNSAFNLSNRAFLEASLS